MKKKILVIAMIALALASLGAGTMASFTARDSAVNTVEMGKVNIAVVETMLADGSEAPYAEAAEPVMPGDEFSKIVRIKNEDGQSCWVRARIELVAVDAGGVALGTQPAGLASVILLEGADGGWKTLSPDDGYLYYDTALADGESTGPLFTGVRFDRNMGNDYMDLRVEIRILAQAVQSANNGASFDLAAGWPAA